MFLHAKLCKTSIVYFYVSLTVCSLFSHHLALCVSFLVVHLSLFHPCFSGLVERNHCLWLMFAVYLYVSNHNSSVKSTLPGPDRHAWAHRALQCLPLYKADFKHRHFRGDVLQGHEVSRLNRSSAPTVSLACTVGDSACIPSVLLWQESEPWLEYQHDNFLTVSLYLSAITLIRWFSLSGFVLSWQRWPGKLSSSLSCAFSLYISCGSPIFQRLCKHNAIRMKESTRTQDNYADATQKRNFAMQQNS